MRRGLSGTEVLQLPVRMHGIRLATPVEVVLEAETLRAVGLEVACGDGAHRFLPLPAAGVNEQELAVESALMLLEEGDLAFYRRRARTLGELRGRIVERRRTSLGTLVDLVFGADWEATHLVVSHDGVERRVPLDERVRILEPEHSTAA